MNGVLEANDDVRSRSRSGRACRVDVRQFERVGCRATPTNAHGIRGRSRRIDENEHIGLEPRQRPGNSYLRRCGNRSRINGGLLGKAHDMPESLEGSLITYSQRSHLFPPKKVWGLIRSTPEGG